MARSNLLPGLLLFIGNKKVEGDEYGIPCCQLIGSGFFGGKYLVRRFISECVHQWLLGGDCSFGDGGGQEGVSV